MREPQNIFSNYWIFKITKWMKLIRISSFLNQQYTLALIFTLLILSAGFVDKSFFLDGIALGLLEHPSIWFFLLLNFLLPFTVLSISTKILSKDYFKNSIISNNFFSNEYQNVIKDFFAFINIKTIISRIFFNILVVMGLICFTWNSFQNQHPLEYLGFDFWDSSFHMYGYLVTRVYKFYLWVGLFPVLIHIILGFIFFIIRMLKSAKKLKMVELQSYHEDGAGGSKVYIDVIIKPLSIPIICVVMLTFVVMTIHHRFDITMYINLTTITLIFIVIYLIPVFILRRIIYDEKKSLLAIINNHQNEILKRLLGNTERIKSKEEDFDLLNNLNSLNDNIRSISTFPNYNYLLKVIAIINSPTIINIVLKYLIPLVFKSSSEINL